jgi:hypothetical protein
MLLMPPWAALTALQLPPPRSLPHLILLLLVLLLHVLRPGVLLLGPCAGLCQKKGWQGMQQPARLEQAHLMLLLRLLLLLLLLHAHPSLAVCALCLQVLPSRRAQAHCQHLSLSVPHLLLLLMVVVLQRCLLLLRDCVGLLLLPGCCEVLATWCLGRL